MTAVKECFVERIRMHEGIDNAILEYLCSSWKRFIYGNGQQAATCLGFFREMGVEIHGVLALPGYEMPRLKGFWGEMLVSAKTVDITDLSASGIGEAAVLLAVSRSRYDAARVFLQEAGFRHIYTCCWDRNQYLRDICMDVFEEQVCEKGISGAG